MKNNHIKYKTLILSALVLLNFGCKKTLDINVSPNNPLIETTTPEVLFPSAVGSTAGRVGGELTIIGGIWAQYYTQANASNQYKTIDAYALTRNDFNGNYNELFSGALADYQLAIKLAVARSDWRYNLMATVMKAYTYQVLVDLYDKVPYTEALKGLDNLQPKFDDGYTVYVGLLAEIDAALAKDYTSVELNKDQKKTDFLFGGDMDLWTKFANTLKLKMYLRMINAKPAEAQAGITKLYTDGANFLTTNAGIATFEDAPNNSNPFYEYNVRRLNTTTNLRASKTFTSWLAVNGDPRAKYYFGTLTPVPMNQGDYTATAVEQPTYAGATVFAQSAKDPVWFISAAESYLMQAEALERYYGGAGAAAMYKEGVIAAFAQVGLNVDKIPVPYLNYSAGTFEQKLEQIIVQKWASFAGSHSLEGFFEQERTGYPKISAVYSTDDNYIPGQWVYSKNGVTSGLFPKRLVFPASSRDRNSNTPAEVPITTKVWWGK
ncbi:SusD/RagB family nutrient-binding outer membrane lipoprotein [Pedobacter riviphilus]|uniref:SusD/RagB family nutrient-binding outer membrane lipoprotein n=1 Tax=Pedobacter riviphilus TaxID=2766984 RepID=A0ABX6TFN6_9SPHI|nr:SusD/RagB family nutrient-binding outer membrane lipoprotein [Pedobacter riviphilus]QNR84122.1 SusD/RagB family nutrient-binding outer membrane lipoprotein [Pedobacter riviphilus]